MKESLPLASYKIAIITAGLACVGVSALYCAPTIFTPGYLSLIAFAILIAPRLSLVLSRSGFILSFSDSVIFLAFLLYGGEAAILTAFIGTIANCIHLKRSGMDSVRWFVPFNAALESLLAAISYVAVTLVTRQADLGLANSGARTLVTILGILALSHFFAASIFAATYQTIKTGQRIWDTWKKQCLSISVTQLTGAGLAGLVFKLISYADPLMIGIAFTGLGLIYLTYRQSIADINSSIAQVEDAEREKAETERERRVEAERHAGQLTRSLQKEEMTNAALRKSEQDFQYAALHDSLTNLANRKQLGDILRKLIKDYKANPAISFHVLFLDIRRFKNINDSLGHTIGDKVLMIAAKRFVRMLTGVDHVARIGGDEFAIILRNLSTVGKAQKVARRIFRSISQPFSLSGNRISITVNIGIAPCDAEYNTPEEILRDADIAMHYAREKDRGVAVFSKDLRERFLERARFEMDLRHAIERNELSMHYQPIVSLQDGHLIGFEALLRWHHGEVGLIPPVKFIPIAEDSGLITPITVWILGETCGQLAKWQKISSASKDLIVSVNISGRHLETNELVDDIELALENSGLDPDSLKLEFTESVAMENAEHTINILHQLKKIGVQLSIDDFGTGYSSLSYLHRLPFDTLKIDRSFVNAVGENGENSEVLQTIISLAKNLKMRVIAEGIETVEQLNLLRNLGCDYGQGYLISKPKPVREAERMIYERPNWLPFDGIEDYDPSRPPSVDANLPVF
ncbi:MAG: bifunctional diguanylate cyclase/phosphodiesterase [Acidobacteriota bacterium]